MLIAAPKMYSARLISYRIKTTLHWPAFRIASLLFLGLCSISFAQTNELYLTSSPLGPSIGPLYDEFRLALEPGRRIEAAGPLFYHEIKETEETWALPPIFSRSHDSAIDAEEI